MSHAYRSGGTFFDLSKPSVYTGRANGVPILNRLSFCENGPFRL